MSHRFLKAGFVVAVGAFCLISPAAVQAQSCAQKIELVQANADRMSSNPRRNSALSQLRKAQAALAAGNERRCLLHVRSAESSLEEWRRNKNN